MEEKIDLRKDCWFDMCNKKALKDYIYCEEHQGELEAAQDEQVYSADNEYD